MALEAMPNYNDLFNYMVFDAQNASHYDECYFGTMENVSLLEKPLTVDDASISRSPVLPQAEFSSRRCIGRRGNVGVQGRKKRRRRPKVCKNQEEAETQRMTHIAVERNRRKQMNEHLAVLRSLMPESYSQRGDQASIVGGAIEFVKELEHLVHSLEAQKRLILQPADIMRLGIQDNQTTTPAARLMTSGFPDVFSDSDPLFTQHGNKFTSKSRTAAGDVEVTLIETHANLRILSKKNPRQLSKLVSGFHSLCLAILHLNVTSLDPLVLYSISVKVEEGCQLTSVDSISQAVHQMLRIIEEDVSSYLTY